MSSLKPSDHPPYKPFELQCTFVLALPVSCTEDDDESQGISSPVLAEEVTNTVRQELSEWDPIIKYNVTTTEDEEIDNDQDSFTINIDIQTDERVFAEDLAPYIKNAFSSALKITVTNTTTPHFLPQKEW